MKYKIWKSKQHARDVSEAHNVKVEEAYVAGFDLAIEHSAGLISSLVGKSSDKSKQMELLIKAIGTAEVNEKGERRE